MKKRTRFFRNMAVTLVAALLISNAGFAAPKRGGDVTFLYWQLPAHFNSAIQSGAAIAAAAANVFVSLVELDGNWQPVPYLAKSWTKSSDNLIYTFKLVEGTSFTDGKPVTSKDVAFSINLMKKYHTFGPYMFGAVDKVETPGQYTVVIKLKQPHPALMIALSSPFTPIMPEHIYGKGDIRKHPANTKPVGSGAFKVLEFKAGKHFILERNEGYMRPGQPYIDRYIGSLVTNPKAAYMAMSNGQAHNFGFMAVPQMVAGFKANKNLNVTSEGYDGIGPVNFLEFNLRKDYISDKRVRKAIAYAIDRDFITQKLHRGGSRPSTGPIHSKHVFYSDQVEHYNLNLDKANALLDEAGFKRKDDGMRFPLTLTYMPGDPLNMKMVAEYLKPQLKKIGIKINLKAPADFMNWFMNIAKWEHDMTMNNLFGWADPVIGVQRMFMSTNIKHLVWNNTSGYNNPEVDRVLNEAAVETDFAKRKAMYARFQKIVADDLPLYFIQETIYHTVTHKELLGHKSSVWGGLGPADTLYWKNGHAPN